MPMIQQSYAKPPSRQQTQTMLEAQRKRLLEEFGD
jgi:hypothetical protein